MASAAPRSTKLPGRPNPAAGGDALLLPVARISRSQGSVSPVARDTRPAARSIRLAWVFSQATTWWSSYRCSRSRYRPCIADRTQTSREMPMRLYSMCDSLPTMWISQPG